MKAQSLRPGVFIDGRKIVKATNGVGSFRLNKSTWSAPARIVTFADGGHASYELGTDVPATGWAEPLPAGGVESKAIKTPTKVRASDKRWAGESVHGPLTTREHDLIAKTNMFDSGRVMGKVGASRDGAGSVRETGGSF